MSVPSDAPRGDPPGGLSGGPGAPPGSADPAGPAGSPAPPVVGIPGIGDGRGFLVALVLLLLALLVIGFGIGYLVGDQPVVGGIVGAFVGSLLWTGIVSLAMSLLRRALLRQGVDVSGTRSRPLGRLRARLRGGR